jgi:hypothetical protein
LYFLNLLIKDWALSRPFEFKGGSACIICDPAAVVSFSACLKIINLCFCAFKVDANKSRVNEVKIRDLNIIEI